MNFRHAEYKDIEAISVIHATCWREVYQFMPDFVLQSRDKEYRNQQWRRWFNWPDGVLYKIEDQHAIVGFCHAGRSVDGELEADGEMRAGYLLPQYRGGRVGLRIMHHLGCWMLDQGWQSAGIWAFHANKFRHWYSHLGWKIHCRRNRVIQDHAIPEVGYRWESLETLIHRIEFLEKTTNERAAG